MLHDGFLRFLDSFEEMFYLLEKITSRTHVLAGEICPAIPLEKWSRAARRLQRKHPILRASIGKLAGQRPFFFLDPDCEIEVEMRSRSADFAIEREVEEELHRSFGAGKGPLLRIVVFPSAKSCVFVLASHHAALDGRSHLLILRDLLMDFEHGLDDRMQAMTQSTSELYGRSIEPYSEVAAQGDTLSYNPRHEIHPIHLERNVWSAEQTNALLRAAAANHVTVHSALLAALVVAGSRLKVEWSLRRVRVLSPIDVRSRLGLQDEVGMLITLHETVLDHGRELDIWDQARAITKSMQPEMLSNSSPRMSLDRTDALVKREQGAWSYAKELSQSDLMHDLMLSNYGKCAGFGVCVYSVRDLFTAGLGGAPSAQKVSVMTYDGQLRMALVSQRPIAGLLQEATMLLSEPYS